MNKKELIRQAREIIEHYWGNNKELDGEVWEEPITETELFYKEKGNLGDSAGKSPARMFLTNDGKGFNYYALKVATNAPYREKFFVCKVKEGCAKREKQGLQDIRNNRASNDELLQNLTKKQRINKKKEQIQDIEKSLEIKKEQIKEFADALPEEVIKKKEEEFKKEEEKIEELKQEIKQLDFTILKTGKK